MDGLLCEQLAIQDMHLRTPPYAVVPTGPFPYHLLYVWLICNIYSTLFSRERGLYFEFMYNVCCWAHSIVWS
jgi:hypothetical protein